MLLSKAPLSASQRSETGMFDSWQMGRGAYVFFLWLRRG